MVSDNDLCPCGSGKPYAECHAKRDASAPQSVGFVIAGAQKSGTTALFRYLREHPQLCMPARKEVHFFDRDKYFKEGPPDYVRYHAYWAPRPEHRLFGDATPSYMYWASSPERIWRYNPAMKFIVVLRNPVTRAFAHWNMLRLSGDEPLPFYEAIRAEAERRRRVAPRQLKIQSYVDRGYYTEQLRRIQHFFPPSQMLILRTEDLRTELRRTFDRITAFLEVDRFRDLRPRDVNSRPYEGAMSAQARDYLFHIFEFEIRQLERLLGWDCSDWLDPARIECIDDGALDRP